MECAISKFIYFDEAGKLVYKTDENNTPIMPDFSYAGYAAGEKGIPDILEPIFDVTAYGAVPNDGNDDQWAIQKAIDAAEAAGGGVVFFPPGTYNINTDINRRHPIKIRKGNIVLRGSGGWEGGTSILIESHTHDIGPELQEEMPGGIFQFGTKFASGSTISHVIGDTPLGSNVIKVDDTTQLQPGMWISLRVQMDKEVAEDMIAPYKMEDLSEKWVRIQNGMLSLVEHHLVQAIKENVIVLREPIKTGIKSSANWYITSYENIGNIGVEDISFQGSWFGKYSHHRSRLDDNGWEAVRLNNLVDSWIRRCSFINLNTCISMESSSYISVIQVTLAGIMGHNTIGNPRRCTGILVGLAQDVMEQMGIESNHGISAAGSSVGLIYWRYVMQPDQHFDMHGNAPYATLLDNVTGGNFSSHGGPEPSFPGHLKHFVVWNFEHVKVPPYRNKENYDFWVSPEGRPYIVKPMFFGLHGVPVKFKSETVGINEAQGTPVSPESLYEAQLADRLGTVPQWVEKAKNEWESLRKKLPTFPRGDENIPSVANKRAEIIKYVFESPVVKTRFNNQDPLGGLVDEWPSKDGSPWPPYIHGTAGNSENKIKIRLICNLGEQIRYTTDGSEPTDNSEVYTVPFEVTHGSTIKTKAYKNGFNPSFTSTVIAEANLELV